MRKFLFFIAITINFVFAYTPSPEAILGNVANADIELTSIRASFEIKKINNEIDSASELSEVDFRSAILNRDYFIEDGQVRRLVNRLTVNEFGTSTHQLFRPERDYQSILKSNSKAVIFWTILDILLINRSDFFVKVVNELGIELIPNQKLINKDKLALINRYKEYIDLIRKDRELEKTLENPFKSDEVEKQENINRILSESFLKPSHQIKLENINSKLKWKISANDLEIWVDHSSRVIESIELMIDNDSFKVKLADYILINGTHFFPKRFLVTNMGKQYLLDIKTLKHQNLKSDQFDKIFADTGEEKTIMDRSIIPQFLL
jgi:hypothetical protein